MSKLYFLSRFPRFMANQWVLHGCETGYTLHDLETLKAVISTVPDVKTAPRCYEDFARATRNEPQSWPCLYVHRVGKKEGGSKPGDVLAAHRAYEGAHLMGNIVDVLKNLDSGNGLNRFRRISVGGNNRFDVPFPS